MLICITGIDGCGKSTQVKLLQRSLLKGGYKVFVSKACGEDEKRAFEDFLPRWSDKAITLAFQALYAEQAFQVKSALKQGKVVIADRWDDGFLVYHERFGHLANDARMRNNLHEYAFEDLQADITFLLDLPVEESLRRMQLRDKLDFFDKKGIDYHQGMRDSHLNKAAVDNWFILNAIEDKLDIHRKINSLTLSHMR